MKLDFHSAQIRPVWIGDLGTWPKNKKIDGSGLTKKLSICTF
jgi:hypothetical protein